MSRIVWLASYPKSGNTWLRIFLANFLRDTGQPVDINAINGGGIASDRGIFDYVLGIESSDMTEEEIERYRPAVYRHLAAQSIETPYLKIHDAYVFTSAGEPLIPPETTSGAVYLARNPLDVAISFAHHSAITIEEAVDRLARETMALANSGRGLKTQLRQRVLSWSGHVSSWLDQTSFPVHVMRYEDMSRQPIEMFASLVRFLDLPEDHCRVRRAAEFSSFQNLQGQELAHGFKERHPGPSSFFRQGRVGGWRDTLTPEQVARIIGDHGNVMRRLGYLSGNGSIPELP